MIEPPVWFDDKESASIRRLMVWFVRQLDHTPADQRVRGLRRKLSPTNMPELFNYTAPDTIEFIWEALAQLSSAPYLLWRCTSGKPLSETPPETPPTLLLSDHAEPLLRQWLDMPRISPDEIHWCQAIEAWPGSLDKNRLLQAGYPGVYTPEILLSALQKLVNERPSEVFSWRQFSARYFAGDSKYLDSVARRQWLEKVLPEANQTIKPRPLLLNAHLITAAQGLLIIENQDSFCWLRDCGPKISALTGLHLVYGHGFTGSAGRARDRQAAVFCYSGASAESIEFERYWFGGARDIPVYFWGDLDFSAIGIIKALRQSFPHLQAWQPGYSPMAKALEQGSGHQPEYAGKTRQYHPGTTGCDYADRVLLPLLERSGQFLDQEWLQVTDF